MKNSSSILVSFILCILIIFLSECKKSSTQVIINPIDTSNKPHFTLLLGNKPLDTIQNYIQGIWKLHYSKGGLAQGFYNSVDSVFVQFSYNRIKTIYKRTVNVDTTLSWFKGRTIYGDSSNVYLFYNSSSIPTYGYIDGIFNDTLVLSDYGSDRLSYYYTKN